MTYDYLVRTSKESEIALTLKEAIRMAKEYSSKGEIATIERAKIINKQSYYDNNYLRAFLFSKELKDKYTWEDFPQIFKEK